MIRKSIIKNSIYAFLLQFVSMLYPLISSPYVSKVLGTDRLGVVNLATSVSNWFSIFAVFGITSYGVREVAKIRDDKELLNSFFSEMILIKIMASFFTLMVYLPLIFSISRFSQEYQLYLLQSLGVFLNIFSFDWFFQGVEEYRYITIRSLLIKLISLISLFVFVNTNSDYLIYAAISIITLAIGNIINFIYALKFIKIRFKNLSLKKHLKPLYIFLCSTLVISVYGILDGVFLGFLRSNTEVAYFTRAMMLLTLCMSLTSTINSVIMPRLTNYYSNNKKRYDELLLMTIDIILLISIPLMAGVFILADDLMLLMGGEAFLPAGKAVKIMAPIIVLVPVAVWNYHQRMLPNHCEKAGLYIQILTAILSVVLNCLLIPALGFIGVSITHLVVDIFGLSIGCIYMLKIDRILIFNKAQLKLFLATVIMSIVVYIQQLLLPVTWFNLFIIVSTGITLYFVSLTLMRDKSAKLIITHFRLKKRYEDLLVGKGEF